MRYLLTAATAHADRTGRAACGAKASQGAASPEGRKLCGRCVKIVEKGYAPYPRSEGGVFGWDVIEGAARLVNANWGGQASAVLMAADERAELEELYLSTTCGDEVTRRFVGRMSDESLLAALDELTAA